MELTFQLLLLVSSMSIAHETLEHLPLSLNFLLFPIDTSRQCWCIGSNGLQALGQKELVFLLECLSGELTPPRDLFSLYLSIYQDAQKGNQFTQGLPGAFKGASPRKKQMAESFVICCREVFGGAG